jgi:hypothetical protein
LSVSIIIPTLNEESCLKDTLRLLRRQQPHEIIVVDGGSRWHRTGLVRQSLRNWLLIALATGGVDPNRLAASYPAVR